MDMTLDWLRSTAEHLVDWGFVLDRTETDEEGFRRIRYALERASNESFALEALIYEDHTRYWMELMDWHGMMGFPYPLDSWRHRDDRVEFKFHTDPITGTGLSLTLLKSGLTSV